MKPNLSVNVRDFGAKGDGHTDDTAALKKAQAAVKVPAGRGRVPTLHWPNGIYNTTEPLHFGYDMAAFPRPELRCDNSNENADKSPIAKAARVCLRGEGRVVIRYTGPPTSDYLLYCAGNDRGFEPVNGLVLDCGHKCRGLFAAHLAYQSTLRNIEIIQSRGIGLDLLGCWGSVVESILCRDVRGVAVRAYQFNSAAMRNIQISGSDKGELPWPDASEGHIRSLRHKDVAQVAPYRRAAMVIHGNNSSFDGLGFEGVEYGDGPAALFADVSTCGFGQLRFEGNDLPGSKIRLARYARQNTFDGIHCVDATACNSLFDCGMDVAGNTFSNIGGQGNLGSVVTHREGFHANTIRGVGFVEDVPLSIEPDSPNTIDGALTGSVVTSGPSVSMRPASYYYNIPQAVPLIVLDGGAKLHTIEDGRPGDQVAVQAADPYGIIEPGGNIITGPNPAVLQAGAIVRLVCDGEHWRNPV